MDSNPLVSIVVRTKDRPKLLRRALQSIAAQTYRPLEVVLVNDGGCDLDADELGAILADASLYYIRLEQNTGRAHAGNVGIEHAKGDYMGFLDDDDEFFADHVVTLVTFLQAHPEYKAVYADSLLSKIVYKPAHDEMTESDQFVYYSQDFSYDLLLIENFIPLNCLMFEKTALRSIGAFDESFDLYEDWDLLIRLAQMGPFHHLAKVTSKVRQWSNTDQITLRTRRDNLDKISYLKLLKKHEKKITHDVIYSYFVLSGIRHGNVVQLRRDLGLLQEKLYPLNNNYNMLETDFNVLEDKYKALERAYRTALEDNERLRNDNAERTRHFSELTEVLKEGQKYNQQLLIELGEIKNSLGWKLLESYRHLKEGVFPRSTRRRDLYEMVLKTMKTYKDEGTRSVYHKIMKRIKQKVSTPRRLIERGALSAAASSTHLPCRKPVDIIVPVYNGYEELKLCMDSVLDSTDLTFHNLLVIDDRSTDKKISEYLKHLQNMTDKKVTVLFNPENLGFIKTVNRGMAHSSNDVILLNSDTVVTRDWTEKLQRAAYSRSRIATVTPFSNHAYHCSIPEPLKYNFLPDDFTIQSFGDYVDRISLRYYPEIPSGSGFCLYITRKVLGEVGCFDDELFEKGYGEETDFCLKARKAGWMNILDDSTYIYHWGGVSFESGKTPQELAEKNRMIERNLIRLRTRHPDYDDLIAESVATSLKPVHEYLRLRLKMRSTS